MDNYKKKLKEALANHLIISFIFSIDIKNGIKYYENFPKEEKSNMLLMLNSFLKLNCEQEIYDEYIKNNIYYLAQYLYENSSDKNEEILNEIKKITNNLPTDNFEFIKSQIAIRDFYLTGNEILPFNRELRAIKNATEEQIDKLKMTYYNSISFDYKFLLLATLDEDSINDYDVYKMNPNFYRSFNFFNKVNLEYINDKNFLNKVKHIISSDIESLLETDFDDDKYDEFTKILNISIKQVKKYDRHHR